VLGRVPAFNNTQGKRVLSKLYITTAQQPAPVPVRLARIRGARTLVMFAAATVLSGASVVTVANLGTANSEVRPAAAVDTRQLHSQRNVGRMPDLTVADPF
jgi:hypothetical protein